MSDLVNESEISRKLQSARRELLDLTARNRLLNTPRHRRRSSSLEIIDELSDETYRRLVTEARTMRFLHAPDEPAPLIEVEDDHDPDAPAEFSDLDQPETDQPETDDPSSTETPRDATAPTTPQPHQVDDNLQTGLASAPLQQRLLRTYYAARTHEEERGVNILYLALGFLQWHDAEQPEQTRHAPLILIPVTLQRRSAGARFRLAWSGEEISTNLSLATKLQADYGLELPVVADDDDDFTPSSYFDAVEQAIGEQDGWHVHRNDSVLWFFSFAKLLMYRDLDPENWPQDQPIDQHPLVTALLDEGLLGDSAPVDETLYVDDIVDPARMLHVLDADSSQTHAIEAVRSGQSLVIQGPPGTGKSQTITNLIAAAVADGMRVLFVSEKMAALEVVQRRLGNIGLGDLCLEIHSHKANKRRVLAELQRTVELDRPVVEDVDTTVDNLRQVRDELNQHARSIHQPVGESQRSPYRIIGELVALRDRGQSAPDFELPGAPATWNPSQLDTAVRALDGLIGAISAMGTPSEHAWRGVGLDSVIPSDVERLDATLLPIREGASTCRANLNAIAELIELDPEGSITRARQRVACAHLYAEAPRLDRAAYTAEAWRMLRPDIEQLVRSGIDWSTARREMQQVVIPDAWTTQLHVARRDLATHGSSILRFIKPAWYQANTVLKSILAGAPPGALDDRLAILDRIIAAQAASANIEAGNELGRSAFGAMWRGLDSDFSTITAIEAWDARCNASPDVPHDFRGSVARLDDPSALREAADTLETQLNELEEQLARVVDHVQLDLTEAFDCATVDAVDIAQWHARLDAMHESRETITRWIAYRHRRDDAQALELGPLVDRLADARVQTEDAQDLLATVYHEALIRTAFDTMPALAEFDGVSHEQVLTRFVKLDRRRIVLARQEVAMAHWQSMQRVRGVTGSVGEMAVLRHEMKKRRRHLPLRSLTEEAGRAIQTIKPVFMMSPLSVAQFLAPGAVEFDLLLIDEASQVRPVDALGAVARAKQIVVVGDERQLPPTRFFTRALDDAEFDEDNDLDFLAGDLESILGLCIAQNVPQCMLRWHYRSRHESLIAISNRAFYDNQLYIVPSPHFDRTQRGVVFRDVPSGGFDRGGRGDNRIEAEIVAEAVMEHARTRPTETLGIGAFSVRQRDAILDALEHTRRQHPELESFFATDVPEPFFVKNLENIQGDERDCIFISVGYGRDADGRLTMNFGPLSAEGGERRLNVLITRAREQCVVFSSLKADDIDLSRAKGRGPAVFKSYLAYANSGELETIEGRASAGQYRFESPLEQSIADTLEAHGHRVVGRVGVAGFFVDLAVIDPVQPGRYLLGIECDGASYASARSARDRNRIRPAVLASRGWRIHRIWSADWFNRPHEQIRNLMAIIQQAVAESTAEIHRSDSDDQVDEDTAVPGITVIRRAPIEQDGDDAPTEHPLSIPYEEASLVRPADEDLYELSPQLCAKLITEIVGIEAPIHSEEITTRFRDTFGLQRAGRRVQATVDEAIALAVQSGQILVTDSDFYVRSTNAEDTSPTAGYPHSKIRDRSAVNSAGLRQTDRIAATELRFGVQAVVRHYLGVTHDEAVTTTARLLGFRSTSPQLRETIEEQLDALIKSGLVENQSGRLHAAEPM